MEIIIQILILFIIMNTLLKITFWKVWQTIIFGLLAAIFIIAVYPYATEQSKTQIQDYLGNTSYLENAAVLITIESAIFLGFCFSSLQELYGKKKNRWGFFLSIYPGLLFFPVLFYLLTQSIFYFSGTDFLLISYGMAVLVFILTPLLCCGLKILIPEQDLRLEILFLVSLLVAILGLLTTVNGNVVYTATEEPLNSKAIILSISLFLGFFALGFLWNRIKWYFSKKNI